MSAPAPQLQGERESELRGQQNTKQSDAVTRHSSRVTRTGARSCLRAVATGCKSPPTGMQCRKWTGVELSLSTPLAHALHLQRAAQESSQRAASHARAKLVQRTAAKKHARRAANSLSQAPFSTAGSAALTHAPYACACALQRTRPSRKACVKLPGPVPLTTGGRCTGMVAECLWPEPLTPSDSRWGTTGGTRRKARRRLQIALLFYRADRTGAAD